MKPAWALAAITTLSTVAAPAFAEETGTEVGLRTGYGIPLGDLGDGKYDQFIAGNIPLWVDLGYRVIPNLMVGGYFMYGFGFLPDTTAAGCDTTVTGVKTECSTHNLRLGAQVHYHFLPWQPLDPWVGAGFGYEWTTFSASADRQDFSLTAKGWEFVNLQAGLDFMTSEENAFGVGPFVSLSVASVSKLSCDAPISGFTCGGDVDATTHEWLTLGVRVTGVP